MLRQYSVYGISFVYELKTEIGVFEARGVANFRTQCTKTGVQLNLGLSTDFSFQV